MAAAGAAVVLILAVIILYRAFSPDGIPTGPVSGINARAQAIFREGQRQGRLPNVFTLVGDSISADPRFLVPIGEGHYDLGEYAYLADTITYFAGPNGRGANPFSARSLAVRVGWMTEHVLNPALAEPGTCEQGESPLTCEYRLSRPAVALIMLGTNDMAGGRTVDTYRANLRQIIDTSINMGVIPVLSTIPPQTISDYNNQRVNEFNSVVKALAQEYTIPLWDYWGALQNVPGYGLRQDGVHLNGPPDGSSTTFDTEHLQYGVTVRNLTALEVLYQLRLQVLE